MCPTLVTVQVIMWQRDLSFGVVGFDESLTDIDFASPGQRTQREFLEDLQSLSRAEIAVNISVLLTELTYFEYSLVGE